MSLPPYNLGEFRFTPSKKTLYFRKKPNFLKKNKKFKNLIFKIKKQNLEKQI